MQKLAETCERIAATTRKLEKTAIVADYLRSRPVADAAVSAVFLSGRPFPAWEETTLQVGGTSLWRLVEQLSGKSEPDLVAAYRKLGDLGAVAGQVLPGREPGQLSVLDVWAAFREIASARGPEAKSARVRELLSHATPLEAKYIVKIMTGDLRIGLKESLVEEAIAKAYGEALSDVQRANMLLGDVGEALRLAEAGKLAEAKMRLFHPLGFMLASPAESAEDAVSYFQNPLVEDKYDGIRAQAHCAGNTIRIFSRTRDDITESFPELPDALAEFPQDAILDGEIVAWNLALEIGEIGRALPFSILQQRLGRKKVSDAMIRQVPVAYLIFDILYAGGELLIDRPLRERSEFLDALLAKRIRHRDTEAPRKPRIPQARLAFDWGQDEKAAQLIRAPVFRASSPQELDALFEAAQVRGNEGLMIKDPNSLYTPGRGENRGSSSSASWQPWMWWSPP